MNKSNKTFQDYQIENQNILLKGTKKTTKAKMNETFKIS